MNNQIRQQVASRMSALSRLYTGIKTTDYVIGAGCALAILGLRDTFDDIDIAVSANTYQKLLRLGHKTVTNHPSGKPVIQILPVKADIHLDPLTMEKPTIIIELQGRVSVKIMSPEALLEQKEYLLKTMGREKDKRDVEALQRYINHRDVPQ